MPAMPNDYESVHYAAREDNCPKAEDSDGVAQWALGMLRAKPPKEAETSEYSLRLYKIIGQDVSLVSLITRMLKVRRLRATIQVSTPKPNTAPHEYGAQEVCAWPQYEPAVHMLLSVMATESRCLFETWPRSLVATRPPVHRATHSGHQLGPLRPLVTAVAWPPPAHSLRAGERTTSRWASW